MESLTTTSNKPSGGYTAPPLYLGYETWLSENVLSSLNAREEVRRRLALAQTAIGYTRAKLPFGAANIKAQFESSLGWSHDLAGKIDYLAGGIFGKLGNRVIEKEDIGKVTWGKERNENAGHLNLMAARAIVARKAGAGVCDDFAAVTLFYLQRHAGGQDQMYRISVDVGNLAHAVIVIGDPGLQSTDLMSSDTSVVVDAWPTEPFAVRAKEWKYRANHITIKGFLEGSAEAKDTLPNRMRALYKVPYEFEGEKYYRRLSDEDETPDTTSYARYMEPLKERRRQAEKALLNTKGPDTESGWTQTWEDVNSLDEELRKKI